MTSSISSHHSFSSTTSTSDSVCHHQQPSSTVPVPLSTSRDLEAPSDDDSFNEQSIGRVFGGPAGDQPGLQLDGDEENQMHLSVVWQGGQLGAAYYDGETAEVHMMRDSAEPDTFTLLNQVLRQVQPKFTVTSAKADERFLKTLQDLCGDTKPTIEHQQTSSFSDQGTEGKPESSPGDKELQLLPSNDYTLEVCKRRILAMSLPCIPENFTEAERTIFFSSLVPFDCHCMVRAVGGLLKYLEKKRVGVELEGYDVRVPVLSLRMFSLERMVSVDENTYSALQIFQKERHPSAYKSGGSGAKEGLSLFGILNKTKSVVGSRLMRVWFMRPSCDLALLNQRQDAVAFFMASANIEVTTSLQEYLKHVKNVARILKQMRQAQASVNDWQALYKTAYSAINIGDICRAQRADIEIFKKIARGFTEDLHYIASIINRIVDFDESTAQNRFVVKANVDADLDHRKRTYNGLPDLMTQVARDELNRLSRDVEECNVIYLPQLGYLLAIPCTPRMQKEKDFNIPGLEFVFLSNNMVHYKSARTKALDVKLGDTQCEITDLETQIMHKLQNSILERSQVLFTVMQYAAELDCLLSLAAAARDQNYIRPDLTEDNIIHISGGRHPLQELCVTPFVPNDTFSGDKYGKMKFLTGPNASGKSVYLKQVGLIAFMSHIGSFVPAEGATIGMLDGIYTRVHTLESVSVGLSTFMIDINQMAVALNNATQNSLVIIDEFGKGTETVDGVALLCACLKHWLARETLCPHVLVSSHFHSIIKQKMLPSSQELTYQTMEVLHSGDEMVFLYQLIEGHTELSYASHISAQAGLPDELLKRGNRVTDLLAQCKPIHRVDSANVDGRLQKCQNIAESFLKLDLEQANLTEFFQEKVLPDSM
ncbi:mutS protein homolog 5-like isoform X2 [Acanthaster planci]|uniref:MutS protein homolog 5 n=1 Tax=Acanthaster planci TaxID=133434 RepID=A0A8B7Y413_ACAPL|nr:mutS protein homolog 5-like isoform X2 [Acanthaster planci]